MSRNIWSKLLVLGIVALGALSIREAQDSALTPGQADSTSTPGQTDVPLGSPLPTIQGSNVPPSPLPPTDDGVIVPHCCDDAALIYHTPGPEEMTAIAQLTQAVIQTQTAAPTWDPNIPTPTLPGPATYLAPSGEWATFTDSLYGYSFEYPSNWRVEEDFNNQVNYIFNTAPGSLPGDQLDPARIKVNIWRTDDLGTHASLQEYVMEPDWAVPAGKLFSQTSEILANGHEVLKQEISDEMVTEGVLRVFLTDGHQVYTLIVYSLNSTYLSVVDHVLDSFVIP